jgi:ABC-2 type transport system permease protein
MTELDRLWGRRAAAFWKEAAIYWSYASRSGLSAFLLLFIIIGSYAYMKILQTLPADYPYWRITTPLLALVLAVSPVRTFLKPADQVFLMPAELRLDGYWRRSLGYSYLFQAGWVLLALLLLWPLYSHCEGSGAASFAAAAGALLLAKAAGLYARYNQGRLLFRYHRLPLEILRLVGAVVFGFMLLTQNILLALFVWVLFLVVHSAAVRLLPKHRIPWEYWIRKESSHLKAHYTFFSWFADVPKLPAKPRTRALLAGALNRLPFDKSETYRFLYGKTFLRTELFGITARILAFAVLLLLVVENTVVEPVIYATALLMSAATVSSLDQMHRYSFWLELYPVDKALRVSAIVKTALWSLLIWNTILGAVFLLFHNERLHSLAAVLLGYLFIMYYTYIPLRRRAAARDD